MHSVPKGIWAKISSVVNATGHPKTTMHQLMLLLNYSIQRSRIPEYHYVFVWLINEIIDPAICIIVYQTTTSDMW